MFRNKDRKLRREFRGGDIDVWSTEWSWNWSLWPWMGPVSEWVKSLSRVWLFVTPWTVAHHAPPSMGFPGKSTGVDCHFLLQRIFPTQGLNPGFPHCRQALYHLSHQGNGFYGNVYISTLPSQIIPPSLSPAVSKSLFLMSVSPLPPCTSDHQY